MFCLIRRRWAHHRPQFFCHQLLDRYRHADPLEPVSCRDRNRRVDADFGREKAILFGRIDASTPEPRYDYEILIALNPRGHGPFDISGIVNIDVVVKHDRMLDKRHAGEQKVEQLSWLRFVSFPQRKNRVGSTARGAKRKVRHVETFSAKHLNRLGFTGRTAEQGDLLRGRMERLKNRVFSMGDRRDLDHVALVAKIITRGLAKRSLGFS